ncbi:5'-AMP-activated protein kinase subunit gamma-1 [Aphelenchoides fujianensis]|nr:5'-AMP-activated protein kinase subunit gamma-1 [Aphelenchoides fujianensis]
MNADGRAAFGDFRRLLTSRVFAWSLREDARFGAETDSYLPLREPQAAIDAPARLKTATILGIRPAQRPDGPKRHQPSSVGQRFASTTPARPIVSPKSTPKSGAEATSTPKRSPADQSGGRKILGSLWSRVKRRSSTDSGTPSSLVASSPIDIGTPRSSDTNTLCEQQTPSDDYRRLSVSDESAEHLLDLDSEPAESARASQDDDAAALAEIHEMLSAVADPTFGGKLAPPPPLDTMAAGSIFHRQLPSPIKKRSIVESVPEDLPLSVDTSAAPLAGGQMGAVSEGAEAIIPGTTERLSTSSAATTDSALSSQAPDSRRGSNAAFGIPGVESGVLRLRRMTVNGKLPHGRNNVKPPLLKQTAALNESPAWQNVSADSQFDETLSDEDLGIDLSACVRRMSVDERTLRSANYAILRKQDNQSFEILGAFCRNESSAYRSYLQSLTVYDMLPSHGLVFMISAELSIRKAIHSLCACPLPCKSAITNNTETGEYNIFTLSDFLRCLQLRREDKQLADQPVQHYFDEYQPAKRMVVTGDVTTVWDVAKLFRMNHVHRMPVVSVENLVRTKEVIGIMSLRPIFTEIDKMISSHCSLKPNLNKVTLAEASLGKRSDLSSISEDALCAEAVDQFCADKISALPLFDANGTMTGVLEKLDVLTAINQRGEERIDEIMETPVKSMCDPKNLGEMVIASTESVAAAIRRLVASHHQCLLIAHEGKLEAVVSYADIMEFLLQFDRVAGF